MSFMNKLNKKVCHCINNLNYIHNNINICKNRTLTYSDTEKYKYK